MAIFFGTSSPNTREKYESNKVISTVEMPLSTSFEMGMKEESASASGSEKLSAAEAEVKKPAKVTPI